MSNVYPTETSGIRYTNHLVCGKPVKLKKLTVFGSSIIVNRVITNDHSYTITASGDDYIIMADTSSNDVNITLPTLDGSNLTTGRIIHIVDAGGNASNKKITISGAQNISGQSNVIINKNYNTISLVSSDSQWFIY